MFNREIHNHYTNNHSSANVEINEHRAPTDESVKLLNEMERKAQENLIMKLSDNRPNSLHVEIFISKAIASIDSFVPKGVMMLRVTINGKRYDREVSMSENFMSWALKNRGIHQLNQINIDEAVKRYIFFQITFLITSAILEDRQTGEYFIDKIQSNGPINLNLGEMSEELKYDYLPLESL